MYDRNEEWRAQIEAKLERERKNKMEEELSQCSFSPRVQESSSSFRPSSTGSPSFHPIPNMVQPEEALSYSPGATAFEVQQHDHQPQDEWYMFTTNDGFAYYHSPAMGETVWERPPPPAIIINAVVPPQPNEGSGKGISQEMTTSNDYLYNNFGGGPLIA